MGVKIEEVIPGTSKQEGLLRLERPDGQVDVQEDTQTWKVHLDTCLCAPGQHDGEDETSLEEDFNTSAYRERGKAKLSSIEEAWGETLVIPPPDLVPMWSQNEDTGDFCGFVVTARNVRNWLVAMHGSHRLNQEKMQMRVTDQGAHRPVSVYFWNAG